MCNDTEVLLAGLVHTESLNFTAALAVNRQQVHSALHSCHVTTTMNTAWTPQLRLKVTLFYVYSDFIVHTHL